MDNRRTRKLAGQERRSRKKIKGTNHVPGGRSFVTPPSCVARKVGPDSIPGAAFRVKQESGFVVKGQVPTDIAAMVYKGMSNFNAIPRSTTVLMTGDQASVDKLEEPVATPTGGDVLG